MPAPPPIDRIKEFPQDGRLWWIRWVDRYCVPKGGTATPGVEVLLSPLDIPLGKLSRANLKEIVASKSVEASLTQTPIQVFTGFIPRLTIGTVFLNGVEVASLPLEKAEFDLHDFKISVCGIDTELDTKPDWWQQQFPYRVINRSEYNLAAFPGAKKSQAVVIRSRKAVIVLPCHEVFRSMYAPHSKIAQALTAGPWELTKTMVINPDKTGIRPDGNWQVTLRRRVPDHFAGLLANLCLSTAGKVGANNIYTGLLLQTSGPGYMTAPIPFDLVNLRLEVWGLRFKANPDKFLALELAAMDWPESPAIVPFRDNSGKKGEIQTPISKDKPYATNGAVPNMDEDGIINANSEEDPLASSTATPFVQRAVLWRNKPEEIEEKKPESFKYEGRPHDDDLSTVDGVSPGNDWSGNTDSGSAAYSAEWQQKRDQSERFMEVTRMLERLHSSNIITHWAPIESPGLPLHAGSIPLWPFPLRAKNTKQLLAFSYLDRKNLQRRGALVCEIQFRGHTIYWLDIELRHNEPGRKALLYTVPKQNFVPATHRLLEIAAQNRGQWPPSDELMLFTGISAAVTLKHTFVKKLTKGTGGRLNEHLAIVKMLQVAEASPQQLHRSELPITLKA